MKLCSRCLISMTIDLNKNEPETNRTDGNLGYSLYKKKLEQWIFIYGLTQTYVARVMGLTLEEFKGKLKDNKPFNREQLKNLIYLMGARNAFRVIHFHSPEQRRRVYRQVFEKYENKERLNE